MDKSELNQFTGTLSYYKLAYPGRITLFLTDGAQYLAEKARAFWLMDVIASYQFKLRKERFQTWHIETHDESAVVWADNGNDTKLVRQEIEYTDFPLDDLTLYAIYEEHFGGWVVMLPGEY